MSGFASEAMVDLTGSLMRKGGAHELLAYLAARQTRHPPQQLVVPYFSIPVTDAQGAFLGTVSHFDVESRKLPDEDFELLRAAATVLAGELTDTRVTGTTA